jgi:hypothetical protein
MAGLYHFGKRMTLPSSVQIKHDLRLLMLAESIKELEQQLVDLGAPPVKATSKHPATELPQLF